MSCSSCGHNHTGSCENPCRRSHHNTPECESLPSQISNFTAQFFGAIVKSEIDGQVVWSLPCSLDIGLPANPRSVDEGLACYFLRLFSDGIIGLTGATGAPGVAGTNGNNSYTVTLHSFIQPTSGSPNVQVTTAFNPAVIAGTNVFIQTSGWYLVTATDGTGTLFLQLIQAVPGATGSIPAGKLVLVTGPQGASVTGAQGAQGNPGPQGPPGSTVTLENEFYHTSTGTDYSLTAVYAPVDFTTSSPAILLPGAGKHLVTVVATVAGLGGVTTSDAALLKLRNATTATDVPGSEQNITNIFPSQFAQLVINCIVTTAGVNQSLELFGRASGGGIISVVAANTVVTAVRIA